MNAFTAFCLCHLVFFVVAIGITITIYLTDDGKFHGPRFYMKEFYVPALDLSQQYPTTAPNNNNNTAVINPCLFFDLAFENIVFNRYSSVRHGDVNLTFSYNRNAVANYVVPSFDQGPLETEYRREVVESRGVPWENVLKVVSNGSTVVFRVDLAARPKVWKGYSYTKKKSVNIGADVEVDGRGLMVKREGIRLDSAASQRGVGIFVMLLSLLFTLQCLFF